MFSQVPATARGEHSAEEARVQAGGQDQEARHQADPRCLRQEADGGADDLDFVRKLKTDVKMQAGGSGKIRDIDFNININIDIDIG